MGMLDDVCQRMENAAIEFVQSLREQFGYTEEEAEHILNLYRREHVIKLQAGIGRYRLVHGMFWEREHRNARNP